MKESSHKAAPPSRVNGQKSFTGNQGELFQQLDQAAPLAADTADLDINLELLGALNTAIRNAKQSLGIKRDGIVDRMNQFLGGKVVTLRQLNSWTAVSQEYKEFPARYLPAFCAATNCDLPLRVLAQAVGRDLVDARDQAQLELGALHVQSAQIRRRQQELRSRLGG